MENTDKFLNSRLSKEKGEWDGDNKRNFITSNTPNNLWDYRELHWNGYSSRVRNIVINVVIMAITIGRMICNRTNLKSNHWWLSTSIIPALERETMQLSWKCPSVVCTSVNIPLQISRKDETRNFLFIHDTVRGFRYRHFRSFNCFFVITKVLLFVAVVIFTE